MDFVYHEEALRDLKDTSAYYTAHAGDAKAAEVIARIRNVIVARARVDCGQAAFYNADDDIYEVPVPRLAYIVSYRLLQHTMIVIAVSHTRRDPRSRTHA